MGNSVFLSPEDNVEHRKFWVAVPESYDPAPMPRYYVENNVQPIYDPNVHNMAWTFISPYQMAEALDAGAFLHFENRRELESAKQCLQRYIEKYHAYSNSDNRLQVILDIFREAVQKMSMTTNLMLETDKRQGQEHDPTHRTNLSELLQKARIGVEEDDNGG